MSDLLGPKTLRSFPKPWLVILALVGAIWPGAVCAQTIAGAPSLALKSGETIELTDLSWVTSNCSSILKATPTVEILEGPPGVAVSIKDAMVVPRWQNCAKRVPGGKLMITADKLEDDGRAALTVRITFKTKDGDRKLAQSYNLSLFP
jgi:hypothetical protein